MESELSKSKPVVFIGPYEHHSNEIMWREGLCEVVIISLTSDGYFDLEDLEKKVGIIIRDKILQAVALVPHDLLEER